MPLKVILDSNFLLLPLQFGIDIFLELERLANRRIRAILPSPVYHELQALSAVKGKDGKWAEAALKYARKTVMLVDVKLRPGETVDDLLLRLATEWKCPVATNDRTLRQRLRNINITTIYLRQKSHLEVNGQL